MSGGDMAQATAPEKIAVMVRVDDRLNEKLEASMAKFHINKQLLMLWLIESYTDEGLIAFLSGQIVQQEA
jgi:hypothetical protein